jgi:uncharacterized protein YjbI with pentapeptide repeats
VARERTERVPPDLEGGSQSQIIQLRGEVDLSEAVITGDFSGCDLIEPIFRQCRLERCQFVGSVLRYARLVDCVLTDSDLSGAVLEECSLSRVEFRNCRASGLQAPQGRFQNVGVLACKLDGANFRMSSWEQAEMTESELVDCDFYGAKMPGSRILRCDLSRAELSRADLAGSRLSGSNLDGVRGASGLRRIEISSDQIIPLALALFSAQRIDVSDDS